MVNAMPRLCRFAGFSRQFFCRVLLCLGGIAAVDPAVAQTFGQQPRPDSIFEHCRSITDDAARLRCYEAATSQPSNRPPLAAGPTTIGPWPLVRTPNPTGGRDAVSVLKTADITKSDIDFAGLMLRCGEHNIEVLVVLVRPLPPRAHPRVAVSTGGKTIDFTASIVPPGAEVLLPPEATALALGSWQTDPELSVEVGAVEGDDQPGQIRGVISLAGLGAALAQLQANCPPQSP
jgi:hypothetical protein